MIKSIIVLIVSFLIASCVDNDIYNINRLKGSEYKNQDTVYLADYFLNHTNLHTKDIKEIAYIAASSDIESSKFYEILELAIICKTSQNDMVKLADHYDLGIIDIDTLNSVLKDYRSIATYSTIEDAIKNYE